MKTLDGFSPNLNKALHIGHLRNLAVAGYISRAMPAKLVAMLGVSLGERPDARSALTTWLHRAGIPAYDEQWTDEQVWDTKGAEVAALCYARDGALWLSDVVVVRSDGRPTYAGHDLAFAKLCTPDYYLTGHEQGPHFASIGLGDKHLPLGLVLDANGHKLKSRDGSAPLAEDVFQRVRNAVRGDDETKDKLAWNIIALAMLTPTREQPLRLDLAQLCSPKAPGMWVSYSYTRLRSALDGDHYPCVVRLTFKATCPAQATAQLMDLATRAGQVCDRRAERIRGGRYEHVEACKQLLADMGALMDLLGLNKLERV